MNIKKYYLTKSLNTRRMEKMNSIDKILVTSSKYNGFPALKNRNIIEMGKYKNEEEFSCHYIVGLKGEIINIIPEDEISFSTRGVNDDNTISIMLCVNKNGEYTKEELISFKKILNKLVKKYKIKEENILLEKDVNNSRRPKIIVDEPVLLYDMLEEHN